MDFNKSNVNYIALKNMLNTTKTDVTQLDTEIAALVDDISLLKGDEVIYRRASDETNAKLKRKEIGNKESELAKKREELTKKKDMLTQLQAQIDSIISELSVDPEVAQIIQKHIKEKQGSKVKSKEYKKLLKDKKAKEDELNAYKKKKDTFEEIRRQIQNKPSAAKKLGEALEFANRINEINTELAALSSASDPTKEASLLRELMELENTKLPNKISELKRELPTIANLNKDFIIDMAKRGFTRDSSGSIDLNKTLKASGKSLDKSIRNAKKELKDIEKKEAPYQEYVVAEKAAKAQEAKYKSLQAIRKANGKLPWFRHPILSYRAHQAEKEQKAKPVEITNQRRKELLDKYKVIQDMQSDAWDKHVEATEKSVEDKYKDDGAR